MTSSGERIVLTRWSVPMALGVLAFTAVFAAGPLVAMRTGTGTVVERILLGVLTVVFAIPFLWTLWRIPQTLRGMGITVDDIGIHPFDGWRSNTFEWSRITAVGFGSFSRTYRGMKTKTMPALEVYLSGADEPAFRYTISPYSDDAARIEQAVRRYRPQVWGGRFLHQD